MNEKFLIKEVKNYSGKSYSQLSQDILALVLSNYKQNGFFVEFGACDGLHLSNTLILENEYSWSGILSEPAKKYHNDLLKNRNCSIDFRAVYSTSKKILNFKETDQSDLSGIEEYFQIDNHLAKRQIGNNYDVETISLNDLLLEHSAPSVIDYMSIDTEGSEFEILKNFNFDRYKIKFISIEHNFVEQSRNDIQNLLEKNNYQRILTKWSQFDDWYVYKDVL
jgi:FkbM family methyltransferase